MRLLLFVIFFFFQASLTHSQVSLKMINLKNGKFDVGFHHYLATDSTRTYQRKMDWNNQFIPRPIPTSTWYPASEKPEAIMPMTILDYMEILKNEEEWEHLPNEHILNWFDYPNTPENQKHLKEPTTAYADIKPANSKFPVIIYAPSYQASSIENFALCEYLASHGYVVVASPSRGTENRWLEGGTKKDMGTQARDIEFLIGQVAQLPYANTKQIATMGFSFGGLSNVLSQMRNKNIKAIVSLDGSIKYQYEKLKKSPFFNLHNVDVPFIHMAQKDIPEQVLKEDKINEKLNHQFEFYDSITNSRAYKLKFHNLTHSYFSTLGVLFQQRDPRQDKSDVEIMESYKLVSTYTLKFLDAFLKSDTEALAYLESKPSHLGIKKGLISHQVKYPSNKSFTFNECNELALEQNYENLDELYDSLTKKYSRLKFPENNLNNLGLQLVFNPKTSWQGVNIFLLATQLYPNSANLFDSLAEAYLFLGEKEKAKENFQKSLDLYSGNQNAIERLKELKK